MSKRLSGGSNTLLNYFNVTPTRLKGNTDKRSESSNFESDNENTPSLKRKQDSPDLSRSSPNDEIIAPSKRRRRIIQDDSDTDDDNSHSPPTVTQPNGSSGLSKFKNEEGVKRIKSYENGSKSTIDEEKPVYQTKANKSFSEQSSNSEISDDLWDHEKFDFLHPNKIRDANGLKPSNPNYNNKTLHVPQDFVVKQTPAMRQWWEIKQTHFDCILFFKVGKFYELYHMDAVTGVAELGLTFMKGHFAHSGFPEIAYERFSVGLINKGFKVARVEQTETPDMMQKRIATMGKGIKQQKVVKREICQIAQSGCEVQSVQAPHIKKPMPQYLLAILEKPHRDTPDYGVCFIDTSIGIFHIGQFVDNDQRSKLLSMIAEYPPVAILEEYDNLSIVTKRILKKYCEEATFEVLQPGKEFPKAQDIIDAFTSHEEYFMQEDSSLNLPSTFLDITGGDDRNRLALHEYELAIRSLGAIQYYLKRCLLDVQLFAMGKMEKYTPSVDNRKSAPTLIIDGTTLRNLHILGGFGTLQHALDHCDTPMGKRLLMTWICHPSCRIDEICGRQSAIAEFLKLPEFVTELHNKFKKLPDLERSLSQIHGLGNKLKSACHPDARAIFYENKTYSTTKINTFLSALSGFKTCLTIAELIRKNVEHNRFLNSLLSSKTENGLFPDVEHILSSFDGAFDMDKVQKEGIIMPPKGADPEYDSNCKKIDRIKREAEDYLQEQCKYFGCKVVYFGKDKKRYQLEVPESKASKATSDYKLEGQKKASARRYHTTKTRYILESIMNAEKREQEIIHDYCRKILHRFAEEYDSWRIIINTIATIDVLLSLTEYTQNQSVEMCAPEFVENSIIVEIRNGIHPFIPNIDNFVPNDTILGTEQHAPLLLLTGPNMGGKSTLMRQVAIITIMAQMGCYVPASYCKLSVVDRIFTRLGARDDIISGLSTFHVELSEALSIVQNATPNSLVLLDELGRGTSTFDGTAIASAYVRSLIALNCRSIFSTHYYSILDLYKSDPHVQLGHMACKVEELKQNVTQEDITFLYKMIMGACPKSYGFNAARLAGIPASITNRGAEIAQYAELLFCGTNMLDRIFNKKVNIRDTIVALKAL